MTPKKRRLFGIISFILPLGFGVFFLLSALNSNIVYFIDPTELISKKKTGQRLRLGGLVKSHSIEIIGTKIPIAAIYRYIFRTFFALYPGTFTDCSLVLLNSLLNILIIFYF